MDIFMYYLIAMNIMTFAAYGIDKLHAIKGKARIRNATLLGLALIGGAFGAFLGMQLFHHKTLKTSYRVGVPLMMLLQIAIFVWLKLWR
ncbi:MAG: DUF1294 domain-containing protein [Lachnospiraceae bacterium]